MRGPGWLCVDGLELVNEARTLQYVENGLIPSGPTANADCACDAISDPPYTSPSADPAPWYEATRPESGEFLGIWAHTIRILSALSRPSRQRHRGGAQIGRSQLTQRIVQVEGLMFASTPRGMAYGERWLEDVLGDDACNADCASAQLELLPACPDGLEGAVSVLADAEAYWLASNWSGSGTLNDLSGNGHHATLTGTAIKVDYVATQYVYFPGEGGSVRADDAPYVSLTGDHGIRAALAAADYTPSADQTIYAKWGAAGQRSIRLLLLTTGALKLEWTTDGTTVLSATSTATITTANDTLLGVRADLDVNDGSGNRVVRFYTRTFTSANSTTLSDEVQDNTGWGQLGAIVTTAGTTSVFNSTAPIEVGSSVSGTADSLNAKVYVVRVASGTSFSKSNVIADFNPANSDNVVTPTMAWGDGVNEWKIVSPSAPSRPITVIDRDYILLDDAGYFEVPDDPGLDVATGEPFTLAVAYVHGPLAGSDTYLIAKKTDDSTAAGYLLSQRDSSATRGGRFRIADGGNDSTDQTNVIGENVLTTLIGVRKRDGEIEAYKDSVGSSTATTDDTGGLANSSALRIGRLSGGGAAPSSWYFAGAAFIPRELSEAELYVLAQELKGDAPRGQQYFRTLRQVGVIDGPEYSPWGNVAECKTQEVSFQFAAGIPQLLAPAIPILDDVSIAAGSERYVMLSTEKWTGDAGTVIVLEAEDGNVTDVVVTARVSLDGTCTSTSGGPPCAQYTIGSLPRYHALTIDSVERKVLDWDKTEKRNVSGMRRIDFDGVFRWLDIAPCSSVCLHVDNNGAVAVRVTILQYPREK